MNLVEILLVIGGLILGGGLLKRLVDNDAERAIQRQLDQAEDVEDHAERTDSTVEDARARVDELEDDIQEREEDDNEVVADDPDSAANRLFDEFGG